MTEEYECEFPFHYANVTVIRRFREDRESGLFLSLESGGVGLNLQAADTVINMDQPWNPARLEQRVARAWCKHQTRPVTVINVVSERTIEHRRLALQDAKRALADGVLDRRGNLAEIRMPTSRAAFMERLRAVPGTTGDDEPVLAADVAPRGAVDRLRDDLLTHHGAALQRILAGGPPAAEAVKRIDEFLTNVLGRLKPE